MDTDNISKAVIKRTCLSCGQDYAETVAVCPHDGTPLVTNSDDALVGTVFAERYVILCRLGEGGMGVVYKARHQLLDRMVAIKMLHPHLIANSISLKRFQQEARTASLLTHPNITAVHDFGVTPDGKPYLILDYLEGIALADVFHKEKHLEWKRAVKIFIQVCDGLAHAHNKGVIHRDLKPTNIMLVENDGEPDMVKLLDFGIAKLLPQSGQPIQHLTQTGEVFGSPLYMSPEQVLGYQTDTRSDIYSLGCVIYEALTGRPPFIGSSMFETMQRHMTEAPEPLIMRRADLVIPAKLQETVMKTLSKLAADRQQTMTELKENLQDVLHSFDDKVPLAVASPSPPPAPKKDRWKLAGVSGLAYAALALLAVIITWFLAGKTNMQQSKQWESYNQLAQIAFDRGDFQESERLNLKALQIAQKFGQDDTRLAITLDRLGTVSDEETSYVKAEQFMNQALNIRTHLLGGNDPTVASTLIHLSSVYKHEGDNRKAELLLKQALDIDKKAYGKESPEVAAVLNQLALLYDQQRRYDEAESLYTLAANIDRQKLGEEHIHVAEDLHNLGLHYANLGDLNKAEPLLKKSVDIMGKTMEPGHPDLINGASSLVKLYMAQQRFAEAQALLQSVLRSAADNPQSKSKVSIEGLYLLAKLDEHSGKYREAEELYQRILPLLEGRSGNDPEYVEIIQSYASLLRQVNRPVEAATIQARLRKKRSALPSSFPKRTYR